MNNEKKISFFKKLAIATGLNKSQETLTEEELIKKIAADKIILEKKAYSLEIDQMLNSGLLKLVYQIEKNGYNLSKQQKTLFLHKFFSKLISDNPNDLLETSELLKNGYVVSDKELINMITFFSLNNNNIVNKIKKVFSEKLNNEDFIKDLFTNITAQDDFESYSYQTYYQPVNFGENKKYINYILNLSNKSDFLSQSVYGYFDHHQNEWKHFNKEPYKGNYKEEKNDEFLIFSEKYNLIQKEQIINNFKENNNILKLITNELFDEFSKNIDLMSYIKTISYIEYLISAVNTLKYSANFKDVDLTNEVKQLENYKITIESQASQFFEQDKEKIITKAQDMNIHMFLENKVVKNIVNDMKNFQISSLPQEAKDIISKIDINMTKCFANIDKLDIQEDQQMIILKEKRLPEIIEKFLRMDTEYRTAFKDHNQKTPQDLLIDSLSNINDILQKNVVRLNMSLMKDISVNHSYTKELNSNKI